MEMASNFALLSAKFYCPINCPRCEFEYLGAQQEYVFQKNAANITLACENHRL